MKLVLSHPGDNLVALATSITVVSGTPLEGYGTDNLANGTWAHPFKIEETTLDLRFVFASAVLPAFPVLGNTNLNVAALLQGHPSDSWGAPDVSQAFGIPTLSTDLFYSSPFKDLSALTAKTNWRLLITGNALPIILGELWLGAAYRSVETGYDLKSGTEAASEFGTILHQTPYKVDLGYQSGPRRETLTGAVEVTTAELATLEAWAQASAGAAQPTMFVLRDDINDARYVRLMSDRLPRTPVGPDGWRVELPVREISRGLYW